MFPKNHEGNGQFPDKRIVRFPFTVLYNLENMEINSILLAFLLTMIAGLSTGVGSLIAFFAKRTNTKFLSAALGFSAGVMIYISFMELMPEALGMLSENFSPRMSNIYMLIAFFSGTSFIALIDFLIPEDENPHEIHRVEELSGQQRLHRTGILIKKNGRPTSYISKDVLHNKFPFASFPDVLLKNAKIEDYISQPSNPIQQSATKSFSIIGSQKGGSLYDLMNQALPVLYLPKNFFKIII